MLKKKETASGIVERVDYPNRGIVRGPEGEKVLVKNVLPAQTVTFGVSKAREGHYEGRLLSVDRPSPMETAEKACGAFPDCGGCLYQTIPYDKQLDLKKEQILRLFSGIRGIEGAVFDGIIPSPTEICYRNKMEFSFGDAYPGGPLLLGLHKRGTTYDIMDAGDCALVTEEVRGVLRAVLEYCREKELPHYHKKTHTGFLRHLLVRQSATDGRILLCIVTSSQEEHDFSGLARRLLALPVRFAGLWHGINDLKADAVQCGKLICLYGEDHLTEEMLSLHFRLSLFSFFQTNTKAAERLYAKVREYMLQYAEEGGRKPVLYDLYSGTGTIAQILAPAAEEVYAIELNEDAVRAAVRNAAENGIENVHFLCGDVGKMLEEIPAKPDFIVVDPPREGLLPKALEKVSGYGAGHVIYISCKATSFARDMTVFASRGYRIERFALCDLFPMTPHVECVTLMTRK